MFFILTFLLLDTSTDSNYYRENSKMLVWYRLPRCKSNNPDIASEYNSPALTRTGSWSRCWGTIAGSWGVILERKSFQIPPISLEIQIMEMLETFCYKESFAKALCWWRVASLRQLWYSLEEIQNCINSASTLPTSGHSDTYPTLCWLQIFALACPAHIIWYYSRRKSSVMTTKMPHLNCLKALL
jgi:hypothetical protein